MLYDEEVFTNFKERLKEMGYDKVFKISAATMSGVEELIKVAAEELSKIPVVDLEISEDEMYIPEEKRFTYEIRVEDYEEDSKVYIIEGTFVDRLLLAVNIHDPDSLRYFHKVLMKKGIMTELREMGIKDGDMVRLNDFEFEYLL